MATTPYTASSTPHELGRTMPRPATSSGSITIPSKLRHRGGLLVTEYDHDGRPTALDHRRLAVSHS
jgi:hypothetical protein